MAKKTDEKLKKVKALVNIKYDENCFKIGDDFEIRKEDCEEMTKRGFVESLEETRVENKDMGEVPKEGE